MTNLLPVRSSPFLAKDPRVRAGLRGSMVFAQVDVPAEILLPDWTGYRIRVVDYNSTERRAYATASAISSISSIASCDPLAPDPVEFLVDLLAARGSDALMAATR